MSHVVVAEISRKWMEGRKEGRKKDEWEEGMNEKEFEESKAKRMRMKRYEIRKELEIR